MIYNVNDYLGVGTRLEWWKTDDLGALGTHSFYEATFGVNVRPHANLTVRPEIRQEWSPAANYDETIFGVDAIMTF